MDTRFDIVIVGSGPAGSSTALHLARHAPHLAAHTLLLEKATHPRPKLCGGGLTFYGRHALAQLGLRIPVPYVPIHHIRFRFADRHFTLHLPHAFWILRRNEFDAWLADEAQQQGVALHEGEAVQQLEMDGGGILIHTDKATYRARAVVAADGSKGLCRRLVQGEATPPPVARLLEVLTPEQAGHPSAEFAGQMATFDFTPVARGVQGYYWDFPSLVDGQPVMNRGIFDSRIRKEHPPAPLKDVLDSSLHERGCALDGRPLQGHPIRWFDPRAPLARPHLLLVGDAAGADPFLGEGIAYALQYGDVAARALADAFRADDFAFADYARRVLAHPVGQSLARRARLARFSYRFHSRTFLRAIWPALGLLGWPLRRWLAPRAADA